MKSTKSTCHSHTMFNRRRMLPSLTQVQGELPAWPLLFHAIGGIVCYFAARQDSSPATTGMLCAPSLAALLQLACIFTLAAQRFPPRQLLPPSLGSNYNPCSLLPAPAVLHPSSRSPTSASKHDRTRVSASGSTVSQSFLFQYQ